MFELEKYPGSSDLYDIDCSGLLAVAETLTAVTDVFALPALSGADALTFGTRTINTAQVTFPDGKVAEIGKVIQLRVLGGTAEADQPKRNYSIILTCTTSASNTVIAKAGMQVKTLSPANNLT